MQISVQRSGGYAGIEETVGAVDTAVLDPDARAGLESLVGEADFFALPDTVEGEVGADQFRYEIAIDDPDTGRRHAVTFVGESGPAAPLKRLVDAVAVVAAADEDSPL
jgi:Emfourin